MPQSKVIGKGGSFKGNPKKTRRNNKPKDKQIK